MRYAILGLALLSTSCASIPGGPLLQGLLGQHISCEMPGEMPFPDTMTLELGSAGGDTVKLGNSIMGLLGAGTIEERLGKAIKDSGIGFRRIAGDAFRQQLKDAQVFGRVVETGGNVGMSLGVGRWGLAYNEATKRIEPVLDLEAKLSVPHFGTVWTGKRSIQDLSGDAAGVLKKVDLAALASKPQGLADIMKIASKDLSKQLIDDLQKNPPHFP